MKRTPQKTEKIKTVAAPVAATAAITNINNNKNLCMHANYTHMQHSLSLFLFSPLSLSLSLPRYQFSAHVPKVHKVKRILLQVAKLSQF